MPTALPMSIRQEIVRRRLDGQELSQIALEIDLSYHSVRQIWRTFRQRGHDGLEPRYQLCGRPPPRRSSPGPGPEEPPSLLGAQVIRVELARELGIAVTTCPRLGPSR